MKNGQYADTTLCSMHMPMYIMLVRLSILNNNQHHAFKKVTQLTVIHEVSARAIKKKYSEVVRTVAIVCRLLDTGYNNILQRSTASYCYGPRRT